MSIKIRKKKIIAKYFKISSNKKFKQKCLMNKPNQNHFIKININNKKTLYLNKSNKLLKSIKTN